jgi:hypothetical protein
MFKKQKKVIIDLNILLIDGQIRLFQIIEDLDSSISLREIFLLPFQPQILLFD